MWSLHLHADGDRAGCDWRSDILTQTPEEGLLTVKILLVEDDELVGSALEAALIAHHYTVEVAVNGQIGLELATAFEYDLILLDWLIPKLDGLSLCRQLRSKGYQKPILLLTAKNSQTDITTGLDAGADDYVVKPYDVPELMARIRALLRRGDSPVTTLLTWGNLCLNPVLAEVTWGEQILSLTPKEYSLLELFLRNPQRLFSRSTIIDRLWSLDDSPSESAVTTHIKELRQKLRASGITEELIETVYGLGYRLKAPPVENAPAAVQSSPRSRSRTPNNKTQGSTPSTQNNQPKGLASINKVLERFRKTFAEQVTVLEQAAIALSEGSWSDDMRQSAKENAHKLAGSLGTFGYAAGSNVARQIEQLLIGEATLGQRETAQFKQLLSTLQQELTKPPVPLTAEPIPVAQTIQVLIIDDDVALTERLKTEGVAWGMQIAIATDATTARLAIAQALPDVVLLDLTFPNPTEDGLTLLHDLTEQFPTLPVLAFTGRDSLDVRVAVSRLGGCGFLHKPVEPKQVFQAIAQSVSTKAIAPVLPQTPTTEAKVIVVDDDPAALTTLSHLLQPWGLQVTTVENPKAFWDVLTATAPDLLLLDLDMPMFSGIDLCQVVRQDPQWGDLPILIVTAHTDTESIRRLFAAGADDFISKPVVGPELVTRVTSRIERVRLRQQIEDIKRRTGEIKANSC
jgi:DNA-binding response OmpR family regulator